MRSVMGQPLTNYFIGQRVLFYHVETISISVTYTFGCDDGSAQLEGAVWSAESFQD